MGTMAFFSKFKVNDIFVGLFLFPSYWPNYANKAINGQTFDRNKVSHRFLVENFSHIHTHGLLGVYLCLLSH